MVLRRHRAARGRRRPRRRPDHHARHRPWRLPALPAQRDHGLAGVVPQDAPRQAARVRRHDARRAAGQHAAAVGARAPARRPDRPGAGHRPGHRGHCRPEPGPPPVRAPCRDRRPGRGAPRHRTLGLPPACRHVGHAHHRHQPVRYDHRHQPDRRPGAWPWGALRGHRQPPQQRPDRQGRRCALHVRRPRRGDERRVDQGLLRPGGGRPAAGPGRGRRGARRPLERGRLPAGAPAGAA